MILAKTEPVFAHKWSKMGQIYHLSGQILARTCSIQRRPVNYLVNLQPSAKTWFFSVPLLSALESFFWGGGHFWFHKPPTGITPFIHPPLDSHRVILTLLLYPPATSCLCSTYDGLPLSAFPYRSLIKAHITSIILVPDMRYTFLTSLYPEPCFIGHRFIVIQHRG